MSPSSKPEELLIQKRKPEIPRGSVRGGSAQAAHGSCGAAQAQERQRLSKPPLVFPLLSSQSPNLCGLFSLQSKQPLLKQGGEIKPCTRRKMQLGLSAISLQQS